MAVFVEGETMRIRGEVTSVNLSNGDREFEVIGEGERRKFRIHTSFVNPPIPIRTHDWQAWCEGNEESGPFGSGATPEAAIDDLLDSISDIGQLGRKAGN